MITQVLLTIAVCVVIVAGVGTVVATSRRPPAARESVARTLQAAAIRQDTAEFRRQLIYGRPTFIRRQTPSDEEVAR